MTRATLLSGLLLAPLLAPLGAQTIKLSPEQAMRARASTELRLSYAASKDYNPYDGEIAELRNRASGQMRAKAYADAVATADRGLARDRLNIQLLIVKSAALRALDETAKADEVRQQWMSLTDSILTSGDGRSFATAFRVISTDEEYAVLQVMGLARTNQKLVEHGGSHFDVLTVKNHNSGEEYPLHFNVDLPFHWLHARLAKSTGTPAADPKATGNAGSHE